MGFILSDVLANLERVSDHCSNIAGCLLEIEHEKMDIHAYLKNIKTGKNSEFTSCFEHYSKKYTLI